MAAWGACPEERIAQSPPRPAPQRGFEDSRVGETFHAPSRTHSESLFYAFQLASGDNAPMHYDLEHCRSRGWPGLMAHGFQTLIQTAPGATGLAAEMEDAAGRLPGAVRAAS